MHVLFLKLKLHLFIFTVYMNKFRCVDALLGLSGALGFCINQNPQGLAVLPPISESPSQNQILAPQHFFLYLSTSIHCELCTLHISEMYLTFSYQFTFALDAELAKFKP